MSCTFSYRLLHCLLAERLDPFTDVGLAVQISFADPCRFRHGIEVDRLLLAEHLGNDLLYTLSLFFFATMRMIDHPRIVAFPGLLTHGASPLVAIALPS